MRVLLTGFEPFDNNPVNPSQMLVERLPDFIDEVEIRKAILPVDTTNAPKFLLAEMKSHRPDAVLAFGLASERSSISLERVALNLMDFRIPDNAGVSITDKPVVEGGPNAYFTTLPIRSIAEALKTAGIPAEISLSAGSYLCNQVFYSLMHAISEERLPTLAGFIHLPALPEQAAETENAAASISLESDIKAANIIIAQVYSAY